MPAEPHITSDSDLDGVLEEFNKRHKRRDSTGPKYNCSISGCGESFKRLDQLDRHEFHHTGVKKHACTYEGCEKIYSILTHLKRHVRSKHERTAAPQKTIKCTLEECGKMFTSSCNMQRHVREAHESPREYPCSFCTAKFSKKVKLRRHEIKQHTQEYPHRCGKCARGFYQQWQQESHQRSCKVYTCSVCAEHFDKWTLYIKHCRETLHGRNCHKCEHCDRSYEKPSDLAKHVASKHPKTDEATEATATAFTCSIVGCNRSYAYKRNLRQHMSTAHAGMRFQCLSCGRGFSSGQNLTKHCLRDHNTAPVKLNATPQETPEGDTPIESPSSKMEQEVEVEVEVKKTRKRRRDAGQSARSQLAKMACVTLDKDVDKEVRLRKPLALKNAAKEIQKQQINEADIEEFMQNILSDSKELI